MRKFDDEDEMRECSEKATKVMKYRRRDGEMKAEELERHFWELKCEKRRGKRR